MSGFALSYLTVTLTLIFVDSFVENLLEGHFIADVQYLSKQFLIKSVDHLLDMIPN